MLHKLAAAQRHYADHGWLKTFHLFSFADYYDPENLHFGSLRVFNDDDIAGERGFGAHRHDNMEIVTLVHAGELSHQDSLGNTGTIRGGEVQYMSAGTGVTHAEFNQGQAPVQLFQIWIIPDVENTAPQYAQKDFSQAPKNVLVPVASGQGHEGALVIRVDATISTAELEAEHRITYDLPPGRGLFVYVRQGQLDMNGVIFESGDQARIMDETSIVITAIDTSYFVAIDVAV